MRNNLLFDDEIAALLSGTAPSGRPDLQPLARLVDGLRVASSESSPRPSRALTALLDAEKAPGISTAALGGPLRQSVRGRAVAASAPRRGITHMFLSWFTGLGLAAKIGIGAATVALGTVGAGAAHALPPVVQAGFDNVLQTVVPATGDSGAGQPSGGGVPTPGTTTPGATDASTTGATDASTTDASTPDGATAGDSTSTEGTATDGSGAGVAPLPGPKTAHAQSVTQAAQDATTQGREHGKAVSEAARQNRGQGGADSPSADSPSSGEVTKESDEDSATGATSASTPAASTPTIADAGSNSGGEGKNK